MSRLPTHIKIQDEFNGIQQQHHIKKNVVVEQSKYNVWNLTFIVEGKLKKIEEKIYKPLSPPPPPPPPPPPAPPPQKKKKKSKIF